MTLLLNLKGYLRKFLRRGSLFYQLLQELEENEQLSYEQLIDYQNQKLRSTIQHAYQTVPYYRRLFDRLEVNPKAIETIDDLRVLPVMSKTNVRGKEKQFISNAVPLKFKTATSGTTGTPVNLFRDYYSINFEHASIWRQKRWSKCGFDELTVRIRGDVVVPHDVTKPPFWKYIPSENLLMMSSYHLSDRFIPYYLEKLRSFNSFIIEAFPSTIYRLARYMQLYQELPIKVKAVFTSAETLFPHQRQVIEEYFGQVFDHYGQSERVAYIARCEHGNYHYAMDYSLIEFLPTEQNDLYKVVGTTFHNRAMPLIRYDTGDFVRINNYDRFCSCGRAFPLVESIEGRIEDYVVTPSGKYVGAMGISFLNVNNLIEAQIIQEKLNLLRVLIVATENFTARDEKVLLRNIQQRVGYEMKIAIEKTDKIQRTKRGKLKITISLLKHEEINNSHLTIT
ncbi:MAG: hypothetical protein QNJ72_29875 [Pleurocapsa sp. MO_226.B13]|nr:hypothetical protein [Pleurocapsa sp. MO_226.B13]